MLACPRAVCASPPRTCTRRPRTSSESPAYGSQESPYLYDNLSPTRQPPSSPPAQLSRSISEIGGPAATKWDADRLHLYTRKGSDAARAAKTRGPVTRPSTLPITALNSREDAYKLLRENQTKRFRLHNVDGVDSVSTLCGSLQDHISLHWSLVNSVSSIRKKRSLLQCGMIDQRVHARLKP